VSDTPEFQTPSDDLLRDWLVGQSDDASRAIATWADGRPSRLAWLARLREGYDAGRLETPVVDSRVAFERVRERMVVGGKRNVAVARVGGAWAVGRGAVKRAEMRSGLSLLRRFSPWIGGIGAALLLAVSIHGRKSSSMPAEYTTRTAEQRTIHLVDGTRVILAPQSRLTVSADFDATTRTVSLAGEGYFDVAQSGGRPFLVQTGRVSTRVLGTTFDIRNYHGDTSVQIAVQSGKVVVQGRHAPFTVSSGKVAYVSDSITLVKTMGDSNTYADWTTGRLVFDETPLPVMLATLGRWYGYEFRLNDSTLVSQHVSAEFKVSNPADMMSLLKSMLGVTLTFHDHVVTLTPQHEIHRARPRLDVFTPSLEIGK
jgi:transmembrane sensor